MLRALVRRQFVLLSVCLALSTATFAQTLTWSSFVGVSGDSFFASAIDTSKNLYLAGRNGGALLVEKISADGTTVLYRQVLTSTPSYNATPEDIRVDASGIAYIVGTVGPNFPTTTNAFQQSVTSGNHAFLAVLNSAGTTFTYASYLAGTTSAQDQANGVALDSTGKVYMAGFTNSLTFPITTGVYQTKNTNGTTTAFVAKFDPTKSGAASLVYSTLLSGPSSASNVNAIGVDGSGDAYVTGNHGADFPVTTGAFQYDGEGLGQGGVYVTKLNPTATALSYSAYIGVGTSNGIAVDGSGDAYLTGLVGVEDFPTTPGAYQIIYPGAFATELNAAGSALVYSTYLNGPSGQTTPTDIALEPGCVSACAAFIVGYDGGNDLPVTNPIQSFNDSFAVNGGGNDFFVTELNGTGAAATLSTYIGGSSDESTTSTAHSPSIAAASTGDIFVLGDSSSSDFPVTLLVNPHPSYVSFRIGTATTPAGLAFPSTLTFSGQQPVGVAGAPLATTLRNMGSAAMSITSITPSPSDYTQTNTCGSTLAGGGECTISVTFNPTTAAARPGTLTISHAGNFSPTVVTLNGTGANLPFVTLSPTSLTFADQSVDTASPAQMVTVTNIAAATLTFNNPAFSISAGFAQTNNCPGTLAQGKSCTVSIAFLPTQNGPFSGSLQVSSNSSGLATTSVALSGTGIVGSPALTLSSAGLAFAPQVIGTNSFGQSLSVVNTGNVPVNIFAVAANLPDYITSGCVQNLNPGGICGVRVTFSPTASGTRTGKITLMDSTPAGTHSFTVTGSGVTPTETLTIDPPSVSFADLAVGATSTPALLIQVTNTGNAVIPISRVFPTGDFRVSSTSCVTTLRVASTCNISVEFAPTKTGARTGTITIEDTASGSPQTVKLSGNGIATAAAAIATPDSITFPTQAQGTTSPTSLGVNLINTGNLPFDASNVTITGTNANDFQIASQGCNLVLTLGRSCNIQVNFTPTGTGARTASLTFTNVAGTQKVTLSGTGVAATFSLGFTPTSLTFQSPQQKGVSSPAQIVWVRNTGTAAITITSITPSDTDYQPSGCVGFPIQPNTSCQLNVTLLPTITTAEPASTLTVTSNATASPQTINLTGSGGTTLPAVQMVPAEQAFNNQVVNTSSNSQFVAVVNNSGASVTGITVATSGGNNGDFIITGNSCSSLTAGNQCSFNVTFKPSATGARSTTVNVTDSVGTQTVAVAGFAVASTISALLVDTALSFPTETVTFPAPQQNAVFQNTGNTPFAISSIALGGTNPGDFTLSPGCPISPSLFNPGNCNVGVSFTPTAAGTRTATVTITDAAPGSPRTITLTGKGVAGAQALEVTPPSITFPPQVVATPSPNSYSIMLTNTGTSPVTISSITPGGTNPGDFTFSNGCPLSPNTLPQGPLGNTCSVTVSFTPTASGSRSATLTITDSAPGSPTVINVSGKGVAQTKTLTITPTTLVFDPQVTGTTSTQQNITVTNTGNFSVTFTNVTVSTGFALSNGCVGALGPNSSCSIGVTFTPTATGKITGTVTITDNVSGSPQTVSLTGTGLASSKAVQLSQTAVVFDPQTVGVASQPQSVYYFNQGNTTVTINTITQTDTEYSLSGSSCQTGTQVGAQSFCTFRITFTPSAVGTRSSSITITDTATTGSRKITLSGVGISSSVPGVNLTPSSLTFATQAEGTTSAAQNINLTNNGAGTLTISSIAVTGANLSDFVQTNNCGSSVAAGFSCNIAVTFSPTGIGSRTASVTVTDNASGSPHSVSLTGTGKAGALPAVTLSPTSLKFANIMVNTSSKKKITVTNSGAAALNVSTVTVTGTVPSDFAESDTCVGVSVAVNGTCTITITFTPTTLEDQTGTVTITDNAANSPQAVPITGNGAEPAVDTNPSSLTFASQKVGTTSAAQTITVENYGNATLTFSGVGVTGPFTISNNTCTGSLGPGLTCTISVEFAPTQTGAANGNVSIDDNAGDSPQFVVLSGTGS